MINKTKRINVLLMLIGLLAAAGIILTGLTWAQPALAQNPVSDDAVNAVAKKLYCPVCENTPLDVCPTKACKDWREMIRQQLSDGWTEQQVMDYFAATFGAQVLAQPPANGFSALVWVLPGLALFGGGLMLWQVLRRWQRQAGAAGAAVAEPATPPAGIAPDVLARIEQEVASRF
jgi:cytochrome c-type biogenesis protein CcmH